MNQVLTSLLILLLTSLSYLSFQSLYLPAKSLSKIDMEKVLDWFCFCSHVIQPSVYVPSSHRDLQPDKQTTWFGVCVVRIRIHPSI
ncbi:unnamed protein product [Linum trigynum]|uniref:Uncharacterized protein n=1 Tax=Linum trigynum TaxID=586398 RepID=A0AAV2ENX6_9ROSI